MSVESGYRPVPQEIQQQFLPQENDSAAFRLEYDYATDKQTLRNDLISYLGEYRLQVQKYDYTLEYNLGKEGVSLIRDHTGESMVLKGTRAIHEARNLGESTYKTSADLIGMQKIDSYMTDAQNGDTLIYASPPDPLVGYTYGFLYVGHVEVINEDEKKLNMTAVRLDENPTLDQYNNALTQITGLPTKYNTPNQFIAEPQIVHKRITPFDIDNTLNDVFQFQVDPQERILFERIISRMKPQIDGFVQLVHNEADINYIQQAFHAIENYALELKGELKITDERTSSSEAVIFESNNLPDYSQMGAFVNIYGGEPPVTTGSCGSSGGRKSANIYGFGSIFGNDFSNLFGESEYLENYLEDPNLCKCSGKKPHFHCPGENGKCKHAIVVGKGITKCPSCGEGKKC